MGRAGLGFEQQLAALTSAPARRFGRRAQSGKLAPGYDADVTVFEGQSLSKVRYTIRGGKVLFSSTAP
jgi:imidazolonepropionase-like amidohydrolase